MPSRKSTYKRNVYDGSVLKYIGNLIPNSCAETLMEYGVLTIKFVHWKEQPEFEISAYVPKCSGTNCHMWDQCLNARHEFCAQIRKRMSSIIQNIEKGYRDQLTHGQLIRIGLELLPMYMQLAKVQVYDQYRGNKVIIDERNLSAPKYYWTYHEIQRLLRMISQFWRDIGVAVRSKGGLNNEKPPVDPKKGEPKPFVRRDGTECGSEKPAELGYYERMEDEIEREKALIAKRNLKKKTGGTKLVKRKKS